MGVVRVAALGDGETSIFGIGWGHWNVFGDNVSSRVTGRAVFVVELLATRVLGASREIDRVMAATASFTAGRSLPVDGLGRCSQRGMAGAAVGNVLRISDIGDRPSDIGGDVMANHLERITHVDLVDELREIEFRRATHNLGVRAGECVGDAIAGGWRIAKLVLVGVAEDAVPRVDAVCTMILEARVAAIAGLQCDDFPAGVCGRHGSALGTGVARNEIVNDVDRVRDFCGAIAVGPIRGIGVLALAGAAGIAIELNGYPVGLGRVEGDITQGTDIRASSGQDGGTLRDVSVEGVVVAAVG